jgi:hypothetical protein
MKIKTKFYALVKGGIASALIGGAVHAGGWFLYETLKVGEWLSFSGSQSIIIAGVMVESAVCMGLAFREFRKLQDQEPAQIDQPTELVMTKFSGKLEKRFAELEAKVFDHDAILKLNQEKRDKKK